MTHECFSACARSFFLFRKPHNFQFHSIGQAMAATAWHAATLSLLACIQHFHHSSASLRQAKVNFKHMATAASTQQLPQLQLCLRTSTAASFLSSSVSLDGYYYTAALHYMRQFVKSRLCEKQQCNVACSMCARDARENRLSR